MVKILALDTSLEACSAAILVGDEILSRFQIAPAQHTQLILPMVAELLAQAELKLTGLDAIAFGAGPGSFTGLRIACGVAQGLGFGAGLPLIPISSLRALAQGAQREYQAAAVLAAFDARLAETYWGYYEADPEGLMQAIIPDQLSKPETVFLPAEHSGNCYGLGLGWQSYSEVLKPLAAQMTAIDPLKYPDAQDIAKLALTEYLAGYLCTPEEAQPFYLRNEVAVKQNPLSSLG